MELNFDKEIDAILRKARDGETAFAATSPQAHLDADEISAFAENALPEGAKMRYTAHLADCERCRKIFSNVIALSAETESEIVHAVVEKPIAAPASPWYKRFFEFPNLAYSLGALALVFGSLIVFTALQKLDTRNSEISQMSEKPLETKSAPMAANSNSSIMANTANSTSVAPANANSAAFSTSNPAATPGAATNSAPNTEPVKSGEITAMPKEETRKNTDADVAKDNAFQLDGASGANVKPQVKEETKPVQVPKTTEDDSKSDRENQPLNDAQTTLSATKKARSESQKDKKLSSENGATTSAGGKTFRRTDNVWYDTAYGNQATTNVTRGTSEYKKLDKDLRVIAENLGGTVVVVWKGKAYRIR
jgi:hypothetical protein